MRLPIFWLDKVQRSPNDKRMEREYSTRCRWLDRPHIKQPVWTNIEKKKANQSRIVETNWWLGHLNSRLDGSKYMTRIKESIKWNAILYLRCNHILKPRQASRGPRGRIEEWKKAKVTLRFSDWKFRLNDGLGVWQKVVERWNILNVSNIIFQSEEAALSSSRPVLEAHWLASRWMSGLLSCRASHVKVCTPSSSLSVCFSLYVCVCVCMCCVGPWLQDLFLPPNTTTVAPPSLPLVNASTTRPPTIQTTHHPTSIHPLHPPCGQMSKRDAVPARRAGRDEARRGEAIDR